MPRNENRQVYGRSEQYQLQAKRGMTQHEHVHPIHVTLLRGYCIVYNLRLFWASEICIAMRKTTDRPKAPEDFMLGRESKDDGRYLFASLLTSGWLKYLSFRSGETWHCERIVRACTRRSRIRICPVPYGGR